MTQSKKDPDMPDASYQHVHVKISNKVAARIAIYYYPALVDDWMVDNLLEEAANILASDIKDNLNKNEGKES